MWRETKILLIDDNTERRRDLAVILNFLGEEHLACDSASWKTTVAELESSRAMLCVMLGDVQSSGELLEQIKHFFENYKDLEKGNWVKVEGWGDAEAARAEITKAVAAYKH